MPIDPHLPQPNHKNAGPTLVAMVHLDEVNAFRLQS